jgi:hypothetical protein
MTPFKIQFLLQCLRILPHYQIADVGSIAWAGVGLITRRGEQVAANGGDEIRGRVRSLHPEATIPFTRQMGLATCERIGPRDVLVRFPLRPCVCLIEESRRKRLGIDRQCERGQSRFRGDRDRFTSNNGRSSDHPFCRRTAGDDVQRWSQARGNVDHLQRRIIGRRNLERRNPDQIPPHQDMPCQRHAARDAAIAPLPCSHPHSKCVVAGAQCAHVRVKWKLGDRPAALRSQAVRRPPATTCPEGNATNPANTTLIGADRPAMPGR